MRVHVKTIIRNLSKLGHNFARDISELAFL